MAGLMSGAMQGAPGPAANAGAKPAMGGTPQGQPGEDGEEAPNVSPEEQAQYDAMVNNGLEMIYPEGKLGDGVRQALQAGNDPKAALAGAAVLIVKELVKSAAAAGQPLGDDVVYHGGFELIQELAEVSGKADIHEYNAEEIEGAWYQALDQYRAMGEQDGSIDTESLKGEFGQVVEADKAGQLGSLLPGIGEGGAPSAPMAEGAR